MEYEENEEEYFEANEDLSRDRRANVIDDYVRYSLLGKHIIDQRRRFGSVWDKSVENWEESDGDFGENIYEKEAMELERTEDINGRDVRNIVKEYYEGSHQVYLEPSQETISDSTSVKDEHIISSNSVVSHDTYDLSSLNEGKIPKFDGQTGMPLKGAKITGEEYEGIRSRAIRTRDQKISELRSEGYGSATLKNLEGALEQETSDHLKSLERFVDDDILLDISSESYGSNGPSGNPSDEDSGILDIPLTRFERRKEVGGGFLTSLLSFGLLTAGAIYSVAEIINSFGGKNVNVDGKNFTLYGLEDRIEVRSSEVEYVDLGRDGILDERYTLSPSRYGTFKSPGNVSLEDQKLYDEVIERYNAQVTDTLIEFQQPITFEKD